MRNDGKMQSEQDYEARARLLALLAGQASDASIAAARRQLATGYAVLARWRRRRAEAAGARGGRDSAAA
jgi:hypothetical protein